MGYPKRNTTNDNKLQEHSFNTENQGLF